MSMTATTEHNIIISSTCFGPNPGELSWKLSRRHKRSTARRVLAFSLSLPVVSSPTSCLERTTITTGMSCKSYFYSVFTLFLFGSFLSYSRPYSDTQYGFACLKSLSFFLAHELIITHYLCIAAPKTFKRPLHRWDTTKRCGTAGRIQTIAMFIGRI
jgi:hypothetical protein